MKVIVVCLFVLLAIAGLFGAGAPRENKNEYSTKYDYIGVDKILSSERLLQYYFNCLVDKGKCTPDGSEVKRTLPDALENACSKCSEKQKKGTEKVIKFLMEKRPKEWDELQKKYDPQGIYVKRYVKEGEKVGIRL